MRELAGALVAPPTDPVKVAVDDMLTAVVLDGEDSVTTVGAVAPLEVAVDDVSTTVVLDGNGSVTTVGALSGHSKRPRSMSNSRYPPKKGKNELPPFPDSDI